MDQQRKPKRSRSATPTSMGGDLSAPPPKKKSKGNKSKQKKAKRNRAGGSNTGGGAATLPEATTTHNKPPKNSMESTATADGQMMAQMLSTFSKLEQSRFEAFQRASFPADAIGKWIAACLSHRFRIVTPPTATTAGSSSSNGGSTVTGSNGGTSSSSNSNNARPLSDLVAVGQEGEICMVVGVLAKIYAQRLVQTAVRQRAAAAAAASTANPQQSQQSQQLLPSDILKAYEERRRLGLDPGFFLQGPEERQGLSITNSSSNIKSSNTLHEQRRLAALQAQDEYDEHVKAVRQKQQQQQQQQQQAKEEQAEKEEADKQQQEEHATSKGEEDDKMQEESSLPDTTNKGKKEKDGDDDDDEDGMVIEETS